MFEFDFNDPKTKTYLTYGVVLIVAFFAIWYLTAGMREPHKPVLEGFGMSADTEGVDNFLVDLLPCSKSCCGQYWPISFMRCADGDAICKLVENGTYIPTNYSCANRDTSGCSCIPKNAWRFLAQRGNNITYDNFGDIMV